MAGSSGGAPYGFIIAREAKTLVEYDHKLCSDSGHGDVINA
jgi:hypothetical protein